MVTKLLVPDIGDFEKVEIIEVLVKVGDKIKKNDLAVGIVLTFFLGLGAYFLFLYQSGYSGSIMSILFGNILTVSVSQLILLLSIAIIIFFILLIIARPLFFSSFHPSLAQA